MFEVSHLRDRNAGRPLQSADAPERVVGHPFERMEAALFIHHVLEDLPLPKGSWR